MNLIAGETQELQLEYNSERVNLIIPEYGRHLQKFIEQISKTQDREKRNKLAEYVIDIMGSLNPHLRDVEDFHHKLWDQLFVMADFNLDVDCPCLKLTREKHLMRPNKLEYPQKRPKYRFYGNNIKVMIDEAIKWEEGEKKDALIMSIANHMKKCYLNWNKDTVTDAIIFEHMYDMSEGKIKISTNEEELNSASELINYKRSSINNNNKSYTNTNKKNSSYPNQKNKKFNNNKNYQFTKIKR